MSGTASRAFLRLLPSLALFPLIFWLQIRAGYEVALFPLYLIPVAHLTWRFGWPGAIASSVVATGLWVWASAVSGFEFTHEWIRVYNGLIRGMIYLFCAFQIVIFRRTVETHRARMEAMRALLNVCHGCGAVQGSGGNWVAMTELRDLPHPIEVPECPACAARRVSYG